MRPGQYPTIEEVRWRRSTLFKPELQKRLMQLLKPTLFGFTNHIIYEKIRADLKAVAVHSFIPVRDDLKSFLLYAHIQQRRGKTRLDEAAQSPFLFIFSGNGYEREAAANAISAPCKSEFEVLSLCYLLNDWVPNVRAAALQAMQRSLPSTKRALIDGVASYLFEETGRFGRMEHQEINALNGFLFTPDIVETLISRLTAGLESRPENLLKRLLVHAETDRFLPDIWSNTSLRPSVRSIALQPLLNGNIKWQDGYKFEWIDKLFNEKRRVPQIVSRPLSISVDVHQLYAEALKDKSPLIVKTTLQSLITTRTDIADFRPVIERLKASKRPAIRERAEFLLRD